MYNDLEERTKKHYTNPMVICATFLDPRYRKFHFIKDEKERENFINKAKNYIISTYLTKFKSKIIQSDEPMPPLPKKKEYQEKIILACYARRMKMMMIKLLMELLAKKLKSN